MKKASHLFSIVLIASVFASCGSDDDSIDYAWKEANEKAFYAIADSVDANPGVFQQIAIPGGPGAVFCKVLKDTTGTEKPKYTSTVTVTYKGWLQATGDVFDDATYRPFTFAIDGSGGTSVIDGWKVALQNMKEGERWQVWIPWSLGYGVGGNGSSIPGYSTLVFDIHLEKIVKN
jgi:peptidylprolyl isomerase/FKBP-type peptidyl-prolyl cis-trans isomerase FklB